MRYSFMHILALDEGNRCCTDVIVGSLNGIILLLCSCHICWIDGLERVLEDGSKSGVWVSERSMLLVRGTSKRRLPASTRQEGGLAEKAWPNLVTFLALSSLARS